MRLSAALVPVIAAAVAGCSGGDGDGVTCGPGTVRDGDRCVPGGDGADATPRDGDGGGGPRADAAPGAPDAAPGAPDAAPGAPDAAPGAPDAAPGAPDAAPGLRVFVTSLRYSANLVEVAGTASAHDAGDTLCQTLADASVLGGTWRAWLSTTELDAIDHIGGDGPWYRMDGAVAFPNRASLATTPMAAIRYDEMGGAPDPFYESWTGTGVGGRMKPLDGLSSTTCVDWTSTIDSDEIQGTLGLIDEDGPLWTDYADGFCSPFSRHLYCFEQ
jgi:hypothetical protein